MRGDEGDDALAEAAYRKASEDAPDFAPSYRALGLACMKRQEGKEAVKNFQRYLELAPEAADKSYILGYIEKLEGRG